MRLRLWDIRAKPFKPSVEFIVGDNFATNCDILSTEGEDLYLVTGHRGFNNSGADIKLWDLRSFGKENLIYTYNKHEFTPEAVRFVGDEFVVSASKDQEMHLIDLQGNKVDSWKHQMSFSSMCLLNNGGDLVAADVKAGVMALKVDMVNKRFK